MQGQQQWLDWRLRIRHATSSRRLRNEYPPSAVGAGSSITPQRIFYE
jgi:hypothetical protein